MSNSTQYSTHSENFNAFLSVSGNTCAQRGTNEIPEINYDIARLIEQRKAIKPFERLLVDGVGDYLKFAKQLGSLVKDLFPNEYAALSFDSENDSVLNIIQCLTDILFANNFFLDVIDDNLTLALTPIKFTSHLYVIDAHKLCTIDARALKIGYAHLLDSLQYNVLVSILDNKKITKLEGTHLEHVIDMGEDFDDEIISNHIKTINKTLRNFHKYSKMDLQLFFDYMPKCTKNKRLKTVIEKGLDLDFSIIKSFADDQFREEALSFEKCFQMAFNEDHLLEKKEIEYDVEYGNWHGVSFPCVYYSLFDSQYAYGFSDDIEDRLKQITDFFIELLNC